MAQIFGKWLKDHSVNNQKIDNLDTYTVKGLVVDPLGIGGVAIGLPVGSDAIHIKRIGNAGIRLDSSRGYRLVSDTGGNFDIIDTSSSIVRLQINPQGQITTNGSILIDQPSNASALVIRELDSSSTATVVKIDNTGSGKFLTASSSGVENFSIETESPQLSLLTSGGTYFHINESDHSPNAVRLQSNAASFFSMEGYDSSGNLHSDIQLRPNEVDINTVSGNSSIVLSDTTVSISPAGTPNLVSTVNGIGINVPDPQVALDVLGDTKIKGTVTLISSSDDSHLSMYVTGPFPEVSSFISTAQNGMLFSTGMESVRLANAGLIEIDVPSISAVSQIYITADGSTIINPFTSSEPVVVDPNGLGIGVAIGAGPQATIDATSILPQPVFNGYRMTDNDPDILMTLSSGLENGPNTVFQIDASGRTALGSPVLDANTKLLLYNQDNPTKLRLSSTAPLVFHGDTQWDFIAKSQVAEDLLISEANGPSNIYFKGNSNGSPGSLTIEIGGQNLSPQAGIDMTSPYNFPIFNGYRPTDTESDVLFTLNSGGSPVSVFQVNAGGDTFIEGDATVEGTFRIEGLSTINNNVVINGNLSAEPGLHGDGNIAGANLFSNGLIFSFGDTSSNNNLAAGQDLYVTRDATVNGSVLINGNETIEEELEVLQSIIAGTYMSAPTLIASELVNAFQDTTVGRNLVTYNLIVNGSSNIITENVTNFSAGTATISTLTANTFNMSTPETLINISDKLTSEGAGTILSAAYSAEINGWIDFYLPTHAANVFHIRPSYSTNVTTEMTYNAQQFPLSLGNISLTMNSNSYIIATGEYVLISVGNFATFTDPAQTWWTATWAYGQIASYVGTNMIINIMFINGTAGVANYYVHPAWPFLPALRQQELVLPSTGGSIMNVDFTPIGFTPADPGNPIIGSNFRLKLRV
jgi:hypothetical protein